MLVLVQLSIGLGVVSTLAYSAVNDESSAVGVTLAVGFTYMTATLIQLDLAAQSCPPEAAGTVFALLMAIDNLAASLGTWLGGVWYDRGAELWGARASFQALLIIGASATACCWLIVPLLPRSVLGARDGPSASGEDKAGLE
jgi:predicted MFS family arabinose efflux permease